MVRNELSVLAAFLTVAEERSFTRAAHQLGVSPSALSHAVRVLEERLGVRLLARTTRSVAPTIAGEQFIARLGPALADVRGAVDELTGMRERPRAACDSSPPGWPHGWWSHRNLRSSPAIIRTSCWNSPRPRKVGSTWLAQASMRYPPRGVRRA